MNTKLSVYGGKVITDSTGAEKHQSGDIGNTVAGNEQGHNLGLAGRQFAPFREASKRREGVQRLSCSRLECRVADLLIKWACGATYGDCRFACADYDTHPRWLVFAHSDHQAVAIGPALASNSQAGEQRDYQVIGGGSGGGSQEVVCRGGVN